MKDNTQKNVTERPVPTHRFTDIVCKQAGRSMQLHLALIIYPSAFVNFSMYCAVNSRYLQLYAPTSVKRDTMINQR